MSVNFAGVMVYSSSGSQADSTGNTAIYKVIVWAKEIKCHNFILHHVE